MGGSVGSCMFVTVIVYSVVVCPFRTGSRSSNSLQVGSIALISKAIVSTRGCTTASTTTASRLRIGSIRFASKAVVRTSRFRVLSRGVGGAKGSGSGSGASKATQSKGFVVGVSAKGTAPRAISTSQTYRSVKKGVCLR